MKKRILAMLLVLCLVASVMPMTVLAAEAKCPGEYAPGFPKEHTLENCDAELIASVPAKNCQSPSYDLYECETCHAKFAANFGEVGEHHLVLIDKTVPAKECGVGYKCDIIGDDGEQCGYVVGHTYNCEGKCVCGDKNGVPGHIFDEERPVIIEAPVACTKPGKAEYTCKNCGEKKIAAITGAHAWGELVAAKSATCLTDGNIAYQQCLNCKIYINDEGEVVESVVIPAAHVLPKPTNKKIAYTAAAWDLYTATGDVIVIIEAADPAALVYVAHKDVNGNNKVPVSEIIPKMSTTLVFPMAKDDVIRVHNSVAGAKEVAIKMTVIAKSSLVNSVAPTCYNKGAYQVACQAEGCKYVETIYTNYAAHDWHLKESEKATCTTYGYEVYACIDCGKIEYVSYEPLAHFATYEQVKAWNDAKGADGKPLNAQITVYKTEPKCATKGSYTWICPLCKEVESEDIPALGCDIKVHTIEATLHNAGETFTYCANENCDCVCTCTAAELVLNNGVCKCGHGGTTWVTIDGKTYRKHKVLATAAQLKDNAANADKHCWVLEGTTANCKQPGDAVYVCSVCGKSKDVPDAQKAHQTYNKEIHGDLQKKNPTCKADGYYYYLCKNVHDGVVCNAEVKVGDPIKYVKKSVQTLEEVKLHKDYDAAKLELIYEGDCNNNGYWKYYCSACKVEVLVKIPGTGAHTPPSDFVMPTADCKIGDQAWSYTCTVPGCGATVSGVVKAAHILPNAAVKGDCLTVGHNAYGTCSVCGTHVEKTEDKNTGKHKFVLDVDASYTADCENWGGELWICSVCGEREIREYVADGHDTYIDTEASTGNCTTAGIIVTKCRNCDLVIETESNVRGYHMNSFGGKIDYSVCGICNAKANGHVEAWRDTGRMAYNYYGCADCGYFGMEIIGAGATCTNDGYTITLFSCEHGNKVVHEKAYNHIDPYFEYDEANDEYIPGSAWVEGVDCGIYTCTQCYLCLAQKDLEPTGDVFMNISDDTDDKVITDGSEITITVDMTGYKAQLFGYSFKIWYPANVLEFVDFEVLTENFKYNAMVNNNVSLNEDDSLYDEDGKLLYGVYDGFVSVIGQSKTDGKNVELTGSEDLVAITFKVINAEQYFKWINEEEELPFPATSAYRYQQRALYFPISLGEIEIVKNVIDDEGKVYLEYVPVIEWCEICEEWEDVWFIEHEIPVCRLMDADFNGVVNYRDAAIVWQMASGALEYNYYEHLDLNGNGEIDHVDAKLIYQYFVGILAYDEVLNYNA